MRYVVDQAELREAERRRRNTSGQLMDIEPPTGRKPEAGGHGTTQNPEREEAEEQAGAGTGPARQMAMAIVIRKYRMDGGASTRRDGVSALRKLSPPEHAMRGERKRLWKDAGKQNAQKKKQETGP